MRSTRTSAVAVTLALGIWLLGGLWAAPRVIAMAYRGEGPELLGRVIGGRGTTPLEAYLSAWQSLFLWVTVLVAAAAVVLYLSRRFPSQRRLFIARLVGGEPSLSAAHLLWYSVWMGLLGGFGEALYRGIRQAVTMRPAAGFYGELYWMAPLSSALAASLLGLVLVGIAAAGPVRWHFGKATAVLGSAAIYGILQSEGIPLHPAAAALLSIGAATALGRGLIPSRERVEAVMSRSRPYFGIVTLALFAAAWYHLPAVVERRAIRGREAASEGLPNVLLIILDTVRGSNLSLYGYERDTSPHLAEWSESAVVFDFALATAPWTLPTHGAVFTGRYNSELHTGFRRPLDDTFPTLAEVLADRGYATAGFAANLLYTSDMSGLERGFDRWEDYTIGSALFLESSWLSTNVTRRLVSRLGWSGNVRKDASEVTAQFLDWRAQQGGRPYFAFLNYFDAHDPYDLAPPSSEFGPRPDETWGAFLGAWRSDPSRAYTPDQAQRWVNVYDNAIAHIDRHLGMIHDALAASGDLDNTIVIVTADHGEMWGEQGLLGHAQALYLPLLHVPLLIAAPGGAEDGRRIATPVSLRDLPATILDLAGVKGAELPGRTLADLWRSSAEADVSPLLAELDTDPTNSNAWDPITRGPMRSLVDGGFHYILNGDGVEELYDLSADPGQGNDVSRDPAMTAELARLRAALDALPSNSVAR